MNKFKQARESRMPIEKNFLFSTADRKALGPIQPLSNWYRGFIPWSKSHKGLKQIVRKYG
jgi:hypothetical protein